MSSHSPANRGRRIGLTGGMGCGKSAAAGIFRELGWGVLESDVIVRELWDTDEDLKQAALKRWGLKILEPNAEGKISRRKVAEIVFAEAGELDWLETGLHPKVRARWQAVIAAEPRKDWVVEIPLLFEKSLASGFDFTLCIASSPSLQASRLAARGLSPSEIAARQARQWTLPQKIERADWVALNDGSLDFLRRQLVYFISGLRPTNL
ncbi:MAG TPA: dephospho-CoA kinase [Opitutales bacterium]|nr:dephospho-CoA kinase [Opitutales bacterium]